MTSSIRVPNTPIGNAFISDLRKIIKGVGTIRRFSRLADRKHLYPSTVGRNERQIYFDRRAVQRNIPISAASHYAVYVSANDPRYGEYVWGMVAAVKKVYTIHNQIVTL